MALTYKINAVDQMKLAATSLTMEGFSFNDVAGSVSRYFSSLVQGLREQREKFQFNDKDIQGYNWLISQEAKFYAYIDELPFESYNRFLLDVPAGLASYLVDYIKDLESEVKRVNASYEALFLPLNQNLAEVISNKHTALSTNLALANKAKKIDNERKASYDKLGKHFGNDSRTAKAAQYVLKSNDDWKRIFDALQSLQAERSKVTLGQLTAELTKAEDWINVILNGVNAGEIELSSQQKANIAGLSASAAQEFEAYASAHFRFQVIVQTLSTSVERLMRKFS